MADQIDPVKVDAKLDSYFKKFKRSTKWWSVCLYSSLFGAALLSALAGVIPQLHFSDTKDLATGLALTASLITTLNGLGRFDQKWRASRLARAHTEALQISLIAGEDLLNVCHQLEQIVIDQSQEVAGSRKQVTAHADGAARVLSLHGSAVHAVEPAQHAVEPGQQAIEPTQHAIEPEQQAIEPVQHPAHALESA
jgi:hypothetical protein